MIVFLVLFFMVSISLTIQFRHVRRVRQSRRAVLERVQKLLANPVINQRGIGYPSMTGQYRGCKVRIHLIADNLALRRLPRLWLAVTVLRPIAVLQPIEVQLRPATTDIVAPGLRYRAEYTPPESWPPDVRVATPADGGIDFAMYDRSLALLRDAKTKDIFLAPGGVRLVKELAQGEVGPHRLTRRVKFIISLKEPQLKALLDDLLRLAERASSVLEENARLDATTHSPNVAPMSKS